MDLGLRDRVYLVTGGSRGLGRAAAEALVAERASVVLSGRDEASATRAAAALGTAHAVGLGADNADPGAAERLAAAAVARFGRLDGALVSVGGPPAGATLDVADEAWRAAFESVVLGALRVARAVVTASGGVRSGEERPGGELSLAFVLSSSVRQPLAGLAVSNGLRPGLAMLAKSLADELGPQGVRVNGLLPGRIDTDRTRELDAAGPGAAPSDATERRAQRSAVIPLRRYGTPEEFGRVAAFVLSPAASYLTGAMVPVDGGLLTAL